MALWKLSVEGVERWAWGGPDEGPQELLPTDFSVDDLLAGADADLDHALGDRTDGAVPSGAKILAPVGTQEIWAAGVTYRRSRDARMEEAGAPDHYDLVYGADRPELFFKANAWRVRAHNDVIGIRADSNWDVPEAELGLVVSATRDIVAYVVANDVSSRSLEGENPLYLPQAKCYTGSCAIGPCLVPISEAPAFENLVISLEIVRNTERVYYDEVPLTEMRRRPHELVDWLFRAMDFPSGVILLTGTALVPPSEFTLRQDDEVSVAIKGLGVLQNGVKVVGAPTETPLNA